MDFFWKLPDLIGFQRKSVAIKELGMLRIRNSSYGCRWEAWRA